jgi:hypothetical protein
MGWRYPPFAQIVIRSPVHLTIVLTTSGCQVESVIQSNIERSGLDPHVLIIFAKNPWVCVGVAIQTRLVSR